MSRAFDGRSPSTISETIAFTTCSTRVGCGWIWDMGSPNDSWDIFIIATQRKLLHCIRIQNMNSVFEFKPRENAGFHMGGCNERGKPSFALEMRGWRCSSGIVAQNAGRAGAGRAHKA